MKIACLTASLFFFLFFLVSCENKKKKQSKEERLRRENFFADAPEPTRITAFKNELAGGHTDFTRSFSKAPIAWQKWEPSLLEKATASQKPILALVGSTLDGSSHQLATFLSEDKKIRASITDLFLCSLIDTHAFPEVALLVHQLAIENNHLPAFPAIIFLSHEGLPLSLIPLGPLGTEKQDSNKVNSLILNAVAMTKDIWVNSSAYAVQNSRSNNKIRQKQIDSFPHRFIEPQDRDQVFQKATRYLSTLYRTDRRDMDFLGPFLPSSTLELLAIGSQSKLLTDETRKLCRQAIKELGLALTKEAFKDHLDGAYFFARKTEGWSLPSFSKSLSSQAKLVHTLILLGTILEEEKLIGEGLSLLTSIEKNWEARSLSIVSPMKEPQDSEKFTWKLEDLNKVLFKDELAIAVDAFSIEKNGNVPLDVDPYGDYFELNTLRRRTPLKTIAKQHGRSLIEVKESFNLISDKLLTYRERSNHYQIEKTLSLSDLALLLRAKVSRAILHGDQKNFRSANHTAEKILKNYQHPIKGATRLPHTKSALSARCIDHANCAKALLSLYQISLEQKWLSYALHFLDSAMEKFQTDIGILSEVSKHDRVVPLRQYHHSMVFGDSSLGILDLCLNRAWSITGDEKYHELLKKHHLILSPLALQQPIYHTDYLASCASGTSPILATVTGSPTHPATREFLMLLNSPKYHPYLAICAASANSPTYSQQEDLSVTLTRGDQLIGTVRTPRDLEKLLNKLISEK